MKFKGYNFRRARNIVSLPSGLKDDHKKKGDNFIR